MIPSKIDNSDWESAFINSDFDRYDVEEILLMNEGESGDRDWILVAKLKNGKFGYLSAGCCYTGWDVQSWGDSKVADSVFELFAMHIPKNELESLFMEYIKGTDFGYTEWSDKAKLQVICDNFEESGEEMKVLIARMIRTWQT